MLTGSSHDQLRIIVESFLQANVKIRTKYKCCVLHHCTEENSLSRDTYYMVKNIMRQILHTLPFLTQYLQIGNNSEFEHVIAEVMSSEGKSAKREYLTQSSYPSIFVRFIKRINELRLDFNVVVAITGIEYAFDMSDM